MKPDVHWSQLRQYRMGLTSEADLVDLRAMDAAEDVIVRFVRQEMHYPNNSSGRLRLLPRNEWRFEAFFWKAYLPIENTLNGKRPRIGP
jgi:hypothetical protein